MTDTTNPTTPDQGDERRASVYDAIKTMRNLGVSLNDYDSAALELLIQWSEDVLSAAQPVAQEASEHYDELKATLQGVHTLCENISGMERRVGPLGSHARGYTHKITKALRHLDALAALAAPQPSQGAQPVVDQKPASMSDNGSCGSQVSGKPVSAEASKGAVAYLLTSGSGRTTWTLKAEELTPDVRLAFEMDDIRIEPLVRLSTPSALPAQAVGEKVTDEQIVATAREKQKRLAHWDYDDLVSFARAILALAAPMPQPEPTSKGENLLPACEGELSDAMGVEWFDDGTPSDEKPASPTAGMTLADRIVHVGGRQNDQGYIEFGSYMAVNALIQHVLRDLPPSQQREPQEAAEREAQLQEAREQGWRAAIDVHSRHGMAGWSSHKDAALSAPQEAGKPCEHCDDTGDVHGYDGEWRGFCSCAAGIAAMNKPSKHGEWVKLSASKEASKVEPVADEARINGETPNAHNLLAALIDIHDDAQNNPPESRAYIDSAWADILREARAFIDSTPSPQALGDDTKRLDWLEKHFTHISGICLDSLNCVQHFEVDCEEDTLESGTTRIREAIDAAILAAAGGGEK